MHESSALIARLRRLSMPVATAATQAAMGASIDAWLDCGLAAGQLHELYAGDSGDAASVAGFAVACALIAQRGVEKRSRLLWLRTEAAERAGGRLHATGFAELGLAPDALLVGVVARDEALLKAAADAARCAGLGMVILEHWGRAPRLDLTATRRLMLAAESSGVCVVSLRVGAEPVPSAAATRWGIAAAPSRALAANAPGPPAFDVELLRRRGGPAGMRWRVEWNRDAQIFTPLAPVSGARLPLAVDRAAARHSPASVRRTG